MREAISEEDRLYNAPKSEVAYVYKGEEDDRPKYKGKYIVEMDREKAEWFSKSLLTKCPGRYS